MPSHFMHFPFAKLLLVGAALVVTIAANANKLDLSKELPYVRDYFYTGGHYSDDGTGTGQHIFMGQMYVERLTPVRGKLKVHPIVFIHGNAQTGTNFLNKPDGGRGWASIYTSHGYTVYIIDQTFRGRSAWMPGNGTMATYSAELIQKRFTAPQNYNLWPQAHLHTQWPGNGTMGDPIFDAYYASTVQFLSNATYQQSTMQLAGAALLDIIGKPVILLSHSQGGLMAWLIADARPNLVHAIISLEPTGPPFHEAVFGTAVARAYGLTDAPLTYSPSVINATLDLIKTTIDSPQPGQSNCTLQAPSPAPRRLVNLANIPVLLLTTQASYHAQYDWCTVAYLRQAGVQTEHLNLPDVGVFGNGHLVFLERNSGRVARLLLEWLQKRSE